MRRNLAAVATAAATAVVLGAGALTAAPAANAATCYIGDTFNTQPCADPTFVSVAASPSTATIGANGSVSIALTAVFDDPADVMRGVDFRIALPDGTTRTVFATGYLAKSGARETYRATYTGYSFYAPGVFRVTALAQRDFNRAQSFSGAPQGSGSFVIKHKVTSSIAASKFLFRKNEKLRFTGTVRNTTNAAGLKVQMQFKANGTKKFKKTSKAVTTKASGAWKTKKIRMAKAGKWRAVITGKGYVVGGRTTVLKSRFR